MVAEKVDVIDHFDADTERSQMGSRGIRGLSPLLGTAAEKMNLRSGESDFKINKSV